MRLRKRAGDTPSASGREYIILCIIIIYNIIVSGNKRWKKGKAYNTCCSQAVTHPGTEQARRCLTAVIRREPVLSAWYGRRHLLWSWCLPLWRSCFDIPEWCVRVVLEVLLFVKCFQNIVNSALCTWRMDFGNGQKDTTSYTGTDLDHVYGRTSWREGWDSMAVCLWMIVSVKVCTPHYKMVISVCLHVCLHV